MNDLPYRFELPPPSFVPSQYDNHIVRRLSDLRGQFLDSAALAEAIAVEDQVLYEVYERVRPHVSGEVLHGISILHPGKIGDEYSMTKGHFHSVLDTAEVYYCLKGSGYMVMETPEGDWSVEELAPGQVLYVPPRWAHRSVNTHPTEALTTFFVYPGHAGHDYGTIEQQGFRKLVLAREGTPVIVDNPRWKPPGGR